jgi:hypothetical protein
VRPEEERRERGVGRGVNVITCEKYVGGCVGTTTYLYIKITRYVERKNGRIILLGCHFQIIAFRLTKHQHVVVLNANIAVNHAILKLFKLTRVGVPACFSNLREEHLPLRLPDLNGVPSGWTASPHFYQYPTAIPHFIT